MTERRKKPFKMDCGLLHFHSVETTLRWPKPLYFEQQILSPMTDWPRVIVCVCVCVWERDRDRAHFFSTWTWPELLYLFFFCIFSFMADCFVIFQLELDQY